jgi:chemotaxis protein MotB
MKRIILFSIFCFLFLSLTGCAIVFQKGRRTDIEKIEELSRAKKELEERLKAELADKKVRLALLEKGLVVTIVTDEVLFDSGKAKIRPEAYPILDKVADFLIKSLPENYIGIEGHTDNEPIKYSGWKSNWELSVHRALSVLHYLVDEKGISPERVSASGYGEWRPVASNETKEGRQLNRRVEIVILPMISKERLEERPEIHLKKMPPLK